MPMPPASRTARLLSTRAFVPRSQTTIFWATFAGSRAGVPPLAAVEKHSLAAVALPPVTTAADALIRGAGPILAAATEAPVFESPFPSVTDPLTLPLCVPAATVVIHGLGCAP